MLVVVVGVLTLGATLELVLQQADLTRFQQALAHITSVDSATSGGQASIELKAIIRSFALNAMIVAAATSAMAGLVTSLLLTEDILGSLCEIGQSSKRIARGQYKERLTVPDSKELARVANNFNQMAESLEQIEAQRVALLGNVTHELRTPLTGLEGYLEGLLDGVFTPEPEIFAQMHFEVGRLKRLVNDLQALSRIEAGQIPLNRQVFDFIPLLERVISQLRPQTEQLELTTDSAYKSLLIYADPDRIAQLLLNLVGNAIRYTPAGGKITIHTRIHKEMAEVTVEDTGIGIPAEALPFLFERFYRVDRSRARSSGGSGIGLTIAHHLVWAMGGELTASSQGVGKGSTFCFTVPLAE
jgi:histidine kinase